jgi:hypothetical protein
MRDEPFGLGQPRSQKAALILQWRGFGTAMDSAKWDIFRNLRLRLNHTRETDLEAFFFLVLARAL